MVEATPVGAVRHGGGARTAAQAAGWGAGLLAVGWGAAAWGLGLQGASIADTAADPVTPVWVPMWVFWAVWVVVYPALGVAGAVLVAHRGRADVAPPLVLLGLTVLLATLFVPVSVLADDVRVTALLDVLGLASAAALGWACARVSRGALLAVVPALVWMPVTTGLKLAMVAATW